MRELKIIINKVKPDLIYTFNSRFVISRPILKLQIQTILKFIVMREEVL